MSARLLRQSPAEVKSPPQVLTDREVEALLRAFIKGKRQILEDDALVVVRWAQGIRMQQVILDMVVQGEIVVSVIDGQVAFTLPPGMAQN